MALFRKHLTTLHYTMMLTTHQATSFLPGNGEKKRPFIPKKICSLCNLQSVKQDPLKRFFRFAVLSHS